MTTTLFHLHLHVRDVDAAVDFYRRHCGMHVARTCGDKLTFLSDSRGFDLALYRDENPAPMPAWFHFGFRLENADAVHAAFARSKAHGDRPIEGVRQRNGGCFFVLTDPDGYFVEQYWEPIAERDAKAAIG
jgi:catechol 2,3-dioxygenase-like lactoylglutathione lyase family enzyme